MTLLTCYISKKRVKEGSTMNNLYPKCTICGHTPPNGLHDGFRLANRFICSRCETQIVFTDTEAVEYEYNIQSIRKVIYG